MATARLTIGGRRYEMACREGEQAHLEALGAMIDARATQAVAAVGGLPETRQLLLAALLLADDLHDAQARASAAAPAPPAAPPLPHDLADTIAAVADRIEALAQRIEAKA